MPAKEKTPSTSKETKGETFLLRLTPDLRKELDAFRTEVKAKSLQTLILQFIVEGMEKEGFAPTQLFSKDLHARQLGMAVGQGSDLDVGNQRISAERKGPQTKPFNPRVLVGAHERVLEALESQKMTSFAALMDPSLMSYRLLLDFCSEDPKRRDPESLVRDFSNGLWFAAEKAMERKKWNFAQILLLQACDLDPKNADLGLAAGIYLIKRLMMSGWLRTKESLGVPQEKLISGWFGDSSAQGSTVEDSDAMADQTEWAIAVDAFELLYRGVEDGVRPNLTVSDRNLNHGGSGKLSCWRDLAFIIRWASSSETDGTLDLTEEDRIKQIKHGFREWEQTFRMTRELSALQREWSGWLDALEVFWWLGYRNEAFEIANEVRSFSSDKDGTERFYRIKRWNPQSEWFEQNLHSDDRYFENRVDTEYIGDDQENPYTELVPYPSRARLV